MAVEMLFCRVMAIISLLAFMFIDVASLSRSLSVLKNVCKTCFKRQDSGHLSTNSSIQMHNHISQLRQETQAASQTLSDSISRMEIRQQQNRIEVIRLNRNKRVKKLQSVNQLSKGKGKQIVHVYQPDSRKDGSSSIMLGLQASFKGQ